MTSEPPNPPSAGLTLPSQPDYPPPPGWTLQTFSDGRPPEYAPPPGYGQVPMYAPQGAWVQPAFGAGSATYIPPTSTSDSMAGVAVAGVVTSIVAIMLSAVPACGAVFIGLGILFSLAGLMSRTRRAVAIIGLAISLVAMGIAIWLSLPR